MGKRRTKMAASPPSKVMEPPAGVLPKEGFPKTLPTVVELGQQSSEKWSKEHAQTCWHCGENFSLESPFDDRSLFCSERCDGAHVFTTSQSEALRKDHGRLWLKLTERGRLDHVRSV